MGDEGCGGLRLTGGATAVEVVAAEGAAAGLPPVGGLGQAH